MKTLIIAEAGVNHNGDTDRALALVDAAADAGADVVKFQTFQPDLIVSAHAEKARYQTETTGGRESQLDMIKKLVLSPEGHIAVKKRCAERNIRFLSTPFDIPSLRYLVDELGVETVKIPSGEITNAPLLCEAARTGCKVILSSGMCTLDDIRVALGVLAFGYLKNDHPGRKRFEEAFSSPAGQALLRKKVTILHCTTEYPTPFAEVNLKAMDTIAETFGLPVGLSDHSKGISVPIAAAARGAKIIEKHFTLSRDLPGPDHKASLEPDELAAMVTAVRDVETALGSGVKEPQPSEIGNLTVVRKSLVAAAPIKKGERFSEKNIGIKRPGGNLPPMAYWDLLGRTASRDYALDEALEAEE